MNRPSARLHNPPAVLRGLAGTSSSGVSGGASINERRRSAENWVGASGQVSISRPRKTGRAFGGTTERMLGDPDCGSAAKRPKTITSTTKTMKVQSKEMAAAPGAVPTMRSG